VSKIILRVFLIPFFEVKKWDHLNSNFKQIFVG